MGSFGERLLHPDANELWMRLLVIGTLIMLSGSVQSLIQRNRAERAAREYARRLEVISHRLVQVQEAERRRLAYELHGELGDLLTELKLSLERSAHPSARATPGVIEALVTALMVRVRQLALDLRPEILADGLARALLAHFKRYTERTQVKVTFEQIGIEGRRFATEVETTIYWLVQEALSNVARHAGASGVTVRILAEPDKISVQVEDHGAGFDPDAALEPSALTSLARLHERARLLGGNLDVKSSPGAGTRVTIELPLAPVTVL
jgi:two-component system sensor histidine kinase UhpB